MALTSRLRIVAFALAAATLLALAPLAHNVAPVLAEPVAADAASYAACGRVFPDPQAYWVPGVGEATPHPGAGTSPWAKGNSACKAQTFITFQGALDGLTFLQETFPRFVEVINLAESDDPRIREVLDAELGEGFSAGVPTTAGGRNRLPLYLVKVTDAESPIPEADRDHFVFPLSIHGIERAGVEGGLRAVEDLATWGATEPDRLLLETAEAEVGGARNVPVGEVLQRSVSYFVLANPDGWVRGDPNAGGDAFIRYNGNGMDLNRDWPEIGYTEEQYTPWSEPETRSFGQVLQNLSDEWTGGVDLHGQLIDRAFSFTLIGGSQRPFDKNERVQQFVEQAYVDAEARLAWSSLIKPNDAPPQCVQTGTGGEVNEPPDCDNRLYGVQYGTIWDTINYTVTGAVGNWIDSPFGLNADGIDNEMSTSHLINCGTGTCYVPEFEQLHVDGNKSLIYAMLNFSLQPPEASFDLDGTNVAFLVNPRRLVHQGAPAPVAPVGAIAPEPQSGQTVHPGVPGTETVLAEFDIANGNGVYTGGIIGEVTLGNAQGESLGSLNNLLIEREVADGEWEEVAHYFNQSPGYRQAGMRVDYNFPQNGQYRLVMVNGNLTGETFEGAPTPLFWELRFSTQPAWPDPGQLPYNVSNIDFFYELKPFVGDGTLTAIDFRSVLSGERDLDDFDTVVAVDDAFLPGYVDDVDEDGNPIPNEGGKNDLRDLDASLGITPDAGDLATMAAAVGDFVRDGGNLVVTDDSLRALEWLGVVPDGSVHTKDVYAGHVSFAIDDATTYEHPLAADIQRPGAATGTNERRQITEPVPIGYEVPVSSGEFQPQWYVDRAAWDAAGGVALGGDGTDEDSDQRVSFGEITVGNGRVRILGSFAPFPTNDFPHPFGLSDYAVTEPGYVLARNLWRYANPGQNDAPNLTDDVIDPLEAPSTPPPPVPVGTELVRYFGSGRVETAVDISRNTFAPGEGNSLVIATAENFPDALAGGPAAFLNGGPVLLTGRDELPAATRGEIIRLAPDRIFVLGGTAAVSEAVVEELRQLATEVERIGGATRFETAGMIADRFFEVPEGTAFIATGANFPDALSGGSAAALAGAPILLVERDAIPEATRAELDRLQPSQLVVLGGTDVISDQVAGELATYGEVVRHAGDDRFGTSAAVSAGEFAESSGTVYVATGNNFPDALAGGPAAAVEGAPILLVSDDIPEPIANELERLDPRRIVILGGTAAVSAEVEQDLADYLEEPAPEE